VDAVAIDNIRWTDASPTTIISTVTESTTTPTVGDENQNQLKECLNLKYLVRMPNNICY
jgi:hypothetical protein